MSHNLVGRPSGSKNQPGHSAGGTRVGAGRKATDSTPLRTPAPSSIQASRSTGTDRQINLRSMFIFIYLFILHLIKIYNTQTLSMRIKLEPLALRIGSIQFLVCFSVRFFRQYIN
jgi:hypothetical protein